MRIIPLHSQFSTFQPECGEFSALFSTENNAENSPHYGWGAENWECGDVLRVISVLWLKRGYNAEISPHSCPNTPIRIFSAFPPHFFPYKNAEISPRSCPNTPIRIFSAFPPHFFPHFLHIRKRRFLRVPVRILPSALSPQGKCGDLGYGYLSLTRSISWLLMPWLLTSPGHQQSWHWLYRICRSFSYLRKDFKYLCHINVEEWHKKYIYVFVPSEKFSM